MKCISGVLRLRGDINSERLRNRLHACISATHARMSYRWQLSCSNTAQGHTTPFTEVFSCTSGQQNKATHIRCALYKPKFKVVSWSVKQLLLLLCYCISFHHCNAYLENFPSYAPLYLYACLCLVSVCQT